VHTELPRVSRRIMEDQCFPGGLERSVPPQNAGATTKTMRLARHRGLNFLLVDIKVGVDVLHVVVIFECFDHAQHLLGL